MTLRTSLSAVVAVCAALALPAAASAEGGIHVIGFQVVSSDPGNGTVTGTIHCVPGPAAGHQITLPAPADVVALAPNAYVGVQIENGRITAQTDAPCDAQLAPAPPQGQPGGDAPLPPKGPGDGPGDGAGRGHGQGQGDRGGDLPRFLPAFANRIWRFTGEANGFDNGQLDITVGKILNLPKRFRSQDDAIVDQDAIVLVGKATRVFDAEGHRVDGSQLADANDVRVEGKLLGPKKWVDDEDGNPTTTIRAKRVVIVD
jgi:hypothetical protein